MMQKKFEMRKKQQSKKLCVIQKLNMAKLLLLVLPTKEKQLWFEIKKLENQFIMQLFDKIVELASIVIN
jgi:hypothetical protein